jgi:dihydrofolate reductase
MTGTLIWHTTLSLDGFITGPDDSVEWAFTHASPSAAADRVVANTGAILAGRRWYDLAIERWGGSSAIFDGDWAGGPVFVLTHNPPATTEDPAVRFVSAGIESAVATALDAAAGKDVVVFGATLNRQCLDAGLLDEIVVHVAPILLGDGIRLFGSPAHAPVRLELLAADRSGQQPDLHYRVLR